MKSKGLRWKVRGGALGVSMALATLAVGVTGLLRAHAADQSRLPASFSGLLNDYSPPSRPCRAVRARRTRCMASGRCT
jgi:hypothetical protein